MGISPCCSPIVSLLLMLLFEIPFWSPEGCSIKQVQQSRAFFSQYVTMVIQPLCDAENFRLYIPDKPINLVP